MRSTERIPDTIQVFEKFHNRYDKWFARRRWLYRSEIEAVSRLVPQGGLGLEVGVGTGRFATPFAVAVGLDPSRAMASIAKMHLLKELDDLVDGAGYSKRSKAIRNLLDPSSPSKIWSDTREDQGLQRSSSFTAMDPRGPIGYLTDALQ